MSKRSKNNTTDALAARLAAFVAERFPLSLNDILVAIEPLLAERGADDEASIDALRDGVRGALVDKLTREVPPGIPETSPGVSAEARMRDEVELIADALDGFFRREAIRASFSDEEKLSLLGRFLRGQPAEPKLRPLSFRIGSTLSAASHP